MRLSVRARIAVAMTVVVAINIATAAGAYYFYSQASEFAAESRAAQERAQATAETAHELTKFLGSTSDLAFAIAGANAQEEYWEYGDVLGYDMVVTQELKRLDDLTDGDVSEAATAWDDLRLVTYVWLNVEAERSGSDFRMTESEPGKYRNSTHTNLETPDSVAGLGGLELRNEVRLLGERFQAVTLGDLAEQADADAAASLAAEAEALRTAEQMIIGFAIASVVLAVLASIWLYTTIARPLATARAYAEQVAEGDLEATIDHHQEDEIGALAMSVENMKDAIVRRMNTMREMAGAVLVTAEGVQASAQKAADGRDGNGDSCPGLDEVQTQAATLETLAQQMFDA